MIDKLLEEYTFKNDCANTYKKNRKQGVEDLIAREMEHKLRSQEGFKPKSNSFHIELGGNPVYLIYLRGRLTLHYKDFPIRDWTQLDVWERFGEETYNLWKELLLNRN